MKFRKKTTVNERYVIAAKVKPKVFKINWNRALTVY